MADDILLDNPSKTPKKKDSWMDSKPIRTAVLVGEFGLASSVIPQQSRKVTYISAAILGTSIGAFHLNEIFDFDYQYTWDDANAVIKGKIEAGIIGGALSVGLVSMRDKKISNAQKMIIAGGMGAVLGYISTDDDFFGTFPSLTRLESNSIGTVIGIGVGVGMYLLV